MNKEKPDNKPRTGAEVVVRALERRDVKWVFGITGREDRFGV